MSESTVDVTPSVTVQLAQEVMALRRKVNAANKERGHQGDVIHTLRLELAQLRAELKNE